MLGSGLAGPAAAQQGSNVRHPPPPCPPAPVLQTPPTPHLPTHIPTPTHTHTHTNASTHHYPPPPCPPAPAPQSPPPWPPCAPGAPRAAPQPPPGDPPAGRLAPPGARAGPRRPAGAIRVGCEQCASVNARVLQGWGWGRKCVGGASEVRLQTRCELCRSETGGAVPVLLPCCLPVACALQGVPCATDFHPKAAPIPAEGRPSTPAAPTTCWP